jgi:hypothetical protein
MGGFVAGLATGGSSRDPQRYMLAIAASNFLLGAVGFTISGCLAPVSRWRHLVHVAVGVWLAIAPLRLPIRHITESVPGAGCELYRAVLALGLEGLMAKRTDSPYLPGMRSRAWTKIKHHLAAGTELESRHPHRNRDQRHQGCH